MDVWGVFLFFLLGERKGDSEAPGRGGGYIRFFIENPRRGGLQVGEGPRGQEGVRGDWGIGGGGLNIFGGGAKFFFSGPKCPPRVITLVIKMITCNYFCFRELIF